MTAPIRHAEWSTSGLIASVGRNGLLPFNQATFTQPDVIAMLNEEAQSTVVPLIIGMDANYFFGTVQVPIIQSNSRALTGVGVAASYGGNVGYALPPDAVGKKLHDVSVITSNGTMVNVPQLTAWRAGAPGYQRFGCFIEGDAIYFFPAQTFNGMQSIQLIYHRAVLALCDDTGGTASWYVAGSPTSQQVASVNYTTGVITFTGSTPASWVVGTPLNFVIGTPQFATEGQAVVTAYGPSTVTVAPASLVGPYASVTLNPGDWVADQGYSPFLQLPAEARNLVTQAAIVKIMQALKDDGWQVNKAKYDEMASAASLIFSPRIDDSPKLFTSAGRGIGSFQRFGPWIRA
jgi:hypothetical protein